MSWIVQHGELLSTWCLAASALLAYVVLEATKPSRRQSP